MALTYPTLGTVAPGDVLRANSGTAAYNDVIKSANQHRKPPMCRVVPSHGVSYTTNTNIPFAGGAVFDTESPSDPMWASGDNTKITIRTAGVYVVTFQWHIVGTSVTVTQGYLKKNGSTSPYLGGQEMAVAASNQGVGSVTTIQSFAATDYIQAIVAQTGTGLSLQVTGGVATTSLTVAWLGQAS